MIAPVPLACRDNVCSGFLAKDGASTWLVTCVHAISDLIDTPPAEAFFTPARFRVLGTPCDIPLYDGGRKRFSVVLNSATGHLIDAISVRLTPPEATALSGFGMHEVASIVGPEVGDTVVAIGFPGLGRMVARSVNDLKPTELRSTVTRVVGVSILLSDPSVGGLSGGPVVSKKGLIGSMQGDVGQGTAMTGALVISLSVIADILFPAVDLVA